MTIWPHRLHDSQHEHPAHDKLGMKSADGLNFPSSIPENSHCTFPHERKSNLTFLYEILCKFVNSQEYLCPICLLLVFKSKSSSVYELSYIVTKKLNEFWHLYTLSFSPSGNTLSNYHVLSVFFCTAVLTIPFSPWSQTHPWCYWCFSSSCTLSPFAPSWLWRCRRLLKHRWHKRFTILKGFKPSERNQIVSYVCKATRVNMGYKQKMHILVLFGTFV